MNDYTFCTNAFFSLIITRNKCKLLYSGGATIGTVELQRPQSKMKIT